MPYDAPPRRIEPIENDTLSDRVTAAIRDAITQGVLTPGQRISERELAAELAVSRVPIRDAIRRLEHEGLLISLPRKGTFVVEITDRDIEEIFSLRAVFEGLAIRAAAEQASPAAIARLHELVEGMRKASARRDFATLWEIDTEFHTTICTLAGNGRLVDHWRLLSSQWRALDALVDQLRPLEELPDDDPLIEAQRQFPAIHLELVRAIERGDPDLAETLMHRHMEIVTNNLFATKRLADRSNAAALQPPS
jgi:DNA-binding GntR family transcriptional regulator